MIKATSKATPTRRRNAAVRKAPPSLDHPPANPRLFSTPAAKAIKKEICAVGRKLWLRQFVDGNGGNISYRIGPNEVICTPTLVSKYDLRPRDLCMVDLDGNQIAGTKQATSEILLHLEIYKKVPEAKAAVHCHPPHATAYAITGLLPPNRIIPEFEIFVGKVAISPYETPGTIAFAQTVLPFVAEHNTVLLSNHGAVCWSDSVTHAEWNCEVLESYCWILTLAAQLGAPLTQIPEDKCADLMARKKRMGLPDVRFNAAGAKQRSLSKAQTSKLSQAPSLDALGKLAGAGLTEREIEALVTQVAREVIKAMGRR